MLSIGLMSGTSMDGIDVALLDTDGAHLIRELGNTFIAYQSPFRILLKSAEYVVRKHGGYLQQAKADYVIAIDEYLKNELHLPDIERQHTLISLSSYLHGKDNAHLPITLEKVIHHSTQCHSDAVKKLLKEQHYSPQQIDVIGYHGQTLFHCPAQGLTLQVGDGRYLSEQLGITVVNDFRCMDVAKGGQGAPFAPLYHQALAIRDSLIPIAVVNCGGIANVTLITNTSEWDVIGFDCGPGNALVDRLVRQRTQGVENMDRNGQYGKQGKVNERIMALLYEKSLQTHEGKNYFNTFPRKSLDYGDMTLISELNSLSLEDGCRTLEAFTADTIVDSLKLVKGVIPQCWVLAGGGWENPVIKEEFESRLCEKLPAAQIKTAAEIGWNSKALEAQIFAYLGVRSLQNRPISMPNTTGVLKPMSGGQAYVPSGGATKVVQELIQNNPAVGRRYG